MNEILRGILNMSYMGSLAILAVLAARLLLKKVPRRFSYLLWAAVLFRFLCPFSIENGLGLLPGGRTAAESFFFSEEIGSSVETGEDDAFGNRDTTVILEADTSDSSTGIVRDDRFRQTDGEADSRSFAGGAGMSDQAGEGSFRNRVLTVLFAVWLSGAAVMVLSGAVSWRRLARRLRVSLPEGEGVYLADGIPTPFVAGILRPRIYLPSDIAREEKQYALLHEREHIRRRDPLWKSLAFLALCIHWFNPLAWAAFFCGRKDMEVSCDEAVLAREGSGIREAYAAALLNLTAGRQVIGLMPLAFGEGNTKTRIRHALKYKKPGVFAAAGAGVLAVLLLAGLFFSSAGLRVREVTTGKGLTRQQLQWYQSWRGGYGIEEGVYLMVGEETILALYQGRGGYSYYKVKVRMDGSVMRIKLTEKDAASEADISDRLFFLVERPDRLESYEAEVDGRAAPIQTIWDARDWDYPGLSEVFVMKTPDVKDSAAVEKLLNALNMSYWGCYYTEVSDAETSGRLTLYFEEAFPRGRRSSWNWVERRREMRQEAEILMALIENCGEVGWSWPQVNEDGETEWYRESWSLEDADNRSPWPWSIKECGGSEKRLEELLIWQTGRASRGILEGYDTDW
ncbi:MAG: hypothetical protein HFI93_03940 [Lachnospiraceae bacterium]|nr:hypothetical protein [Lachnospiraceae bacterium]